jgi:hypothetical protein
LGQMIKICKRWFYFAYDRNRMRNYFNSVLYFDNLGEFSPSWFVSILGIMRLDCNMKTAALGGFTRRNEPKQQYWPFFFCSFDRLITLRSINKTFIIKQLSVILQLIFDRQTKFNSLCRRERAVEKL